MQSVDMVFTLGLPFYQAGIGHTECAPQYSHRARGELKGSEGKAPGA